MRKGIGGFYTVDEARDPRGPLHLHRPGQIPQGPHLPLRGGIGCASWPRRTAPAPWRRSCPRRNFLVRPPIANIDQLFIVSSLRDPYPEPLIVDKTIAVAELEDIQPHSGADQNRFGGPLAPLKRCTIWPGVPCLEVSSVTGAGRGPGAPAAGGEGLRLYGQLRCGEVHLAQRPVPRVRLENRGRSAKSWAAAATPPGRWSSTSWRVAAMWRIPPASPPLTSSATA